MWQNILTQVILYIVGAVVTGLGSLLMYWISTKIKDEKLKNVLTEAASVVTNGVDFIYQTYVSGLKGTDLWDEDAMVTANAKAIEYIKNNLTQDMINVITKNGKDIEEWAKEQIEIAIKLSKDKAKSR